MMQNFLTLKKICFSLTVVSLIIQIHLHLGHVLLSSMVIAHSEREFENVQTINKFKQQEMYISEHRTQY